MKYSILIPAYNEEQSIKELYDRITSVMDKVALDDYEILFVDDGSTDRTPEEIKKLAAKDKKVRYVVFRKNLGKSAGLSVGFERIRGDYVITMDADLQDEPKEIPKLIRKMQDGYDLVSGWKEDRQYPIDKTLPSKVFNAIVSKSTGLHFHDFNCGFKLYKREVVSELVIYGQLYRFIPALAFERGFKCAEIKVRHNKRKYGKSKYTWKRIFAGIMDIMTVVFLQKFSRRPMHIFGFTGLILFVVGFVSLVYLMILKFILGQHISDRPLMTFGAVFLLAGLQLIFTGLLAEMLTRYNHKNSIYPIKEDSTLLG